jgi:hypothetical protein
MVAANWITLGVAIATLISGWCQFWVKERLFTRSSPASDKVLAIFKSRIGISFIAFTGILSAVSIGLLVVQVVSKKPLDRVACFQISALTALAFFNFVLVHSLFTLRRLAVLRQEIRDA